MWGMRGSLCVLGPLLARLKKATVSMPGGCVIGTRPVDLHRKAMEALGAKVEVDKGYIVAKTRKLVGGEMFLGGRAGPTVLGTANAMMAATLAEGETIIEGAACEPEVVDLGHCLNAMGAKIEGLGSIRKPQHFAHPVFRDFPVRLRYSLIKKAQAVAHRPVGGARDQMQSRRGNLTTLVLGDSREMRA